MIDESSNRRFQHLAAGWLREVRAAAAEQGTNPVVVDGLALDVLDLLRHRLHDELGALLHSADLGPEHTPHRRWPTWPRRTRPADPSPAGTSPAPCDVLFVVHGSSDHSIMSPVVESLAARGLSSGHLAVSGAAVGPLDDGTTAAWVIDRARVLTSAQLAVYVARAVRSIRSIATMVVPVDIVGDRQLTDHDVVRRRLARRTVRVASLAVPDLITRATTVRSALLDARPRVVVVSDPDELTARTALVVAEQLGIATVAIESAPIGDGDLRWQELPADLVCVRGDSGRHALRSAGVADHRIAVTGAPHLSAVKVPNSSASTGADAIADRIAALPSGVHRGARSHSLAAGAVSGDASRATPSTP